MRSVIFGLAIFASAVTAVTAYGQSQENNPWEIIDPVQIVHVFVPVKEWQSCDRWLSAREHRTAETQRLEDWALGYATAYMAELSNEQNARTKLSNEDLLKAVDDNCKAAGAVGPAIQQTLDQAA